MIYTKSQAYSEAYIDKLYTLLGNPASSSLLGFGLSGLTILKRRFPEETRSYLHHIITHKWNTLRHLPLENKVSFFNLDTNQYDEYEKERQSLKAELSQNWESTLDKAFDTYKQSHDFVGFELFTDKPQSNKKLTKSQTEMLGYFFDGKMFNVIGWESYIKQMMLSHLPDFSVRQRSKNIIEVYKALSESTEILIEIDITFFKKFGLLIKSFGVASYDVFCFVVVTKQGVESRIPLSEFMFISSFIKRRKFPKISSDNAKRELFFQLYLYCVLINEMLPLTEGFLIENESLIVRHKLVTPS